MRHAVKVTVRAGCALALLGLSVGAQAQDADKVVIHGYGGWAAGYSSNANNFASIASEDGHLNNYSFALNVTAQLQEKVEVRAQPCWRSDIGGPAVELDYAFAQYSFSPSAAVRVGKVKNPLGLYTEILDVGTLRPFYLLPQGRYDGIPPSYVGAGALARVPAGKWELEVDAFMGQQDYEPVTLEMPVGVDPVTQAPILGSIVILSEGRRMLGGRANLRTPLSGLTLGVSGSTSNIYSGMAGQEMVESVKNLNFLVGQLEFVSDKLTLRSEYRRTTGAADMTSFYAELAYRFTRHLELASTYDWGDRTKVSNLPVKQLGEHTAVGFGLNFWPDPRLVVKLDYYHIDGNSLARPDSALQAALAGTLEKTTNVLVVGTQFSF